MKEFSNILSVYPISEITIEDPQPWENEITGDHTFSADDFIFDPSPSDNDAGTLYVCDQTFNISTPSDAELSSFATPVNSILVLRDDSGSKYSIGTKTLPGTVIIQKGIQKSRLIFKCNSISNPI